MKIDDRKTILLMLWANYPFVQDAAEAIRDYQPATGPWRLVLKTHAPSVLRPESLAAIGSIDGVIGFLPDLATQSAVAALGIPTVNISSHVTESQLPQVILDNAAAGRIAAEHFLKMGFTSLAFLGSPTEFSRRRGEGFREVAAGAGLAVTDLSNARSDIQAVVQQLSTMKKPVGLLTSQDNDGLQMISLCLAKGLRVPEDVAVVGVDNTRLMCEMAEVPLSSVQTPGHAIGLAAADYLDRQLQGEPPPSMPILIPPTELVARTSSDIIALADPLTARAVSHLRRRALEPIGVDQIADELSLSRRSLERRIKKALGRSPLAELRRVRFAHAASRLLSTDRNIEQIAAESGFGDLRNFFRAFRQHHGVTPTEFRRNKPPNPLR